jgi:DNA polymerase
MQTCWPYLLEQIKCVRPKVIVALGGTAVEGLLGRKTVGITRLRGQFDDFRGIPLMPTYHPSYVLRHPVNRIKRQIWEDMLSVLRFLGHPISDQQESYFRS